MLSPIILFVYNRLSHTQKVVEALQRNELADESVLYVFCDGPKENATEEQKDKVAEVQAFSQTITGFKEIHIEISKTNKGLANSVISGVTKIINQYGKAIVVEDDIVTHPFFLRYMNDCLETYIDRQDIYMIGGYNCNINIPDSYNEDIYVVHRACTWGWATWKSRWLQADWTVRDYRMMCDNVTLQDRFNRGGEDMFPLLRAQMEGMIDSWAIRWDYTMYKHDGLCVRPIRTLCHNCGFDGSGVHCGCMPCNFTAPLYDSNCYNITLYKEVSLNNRIAKEFSFFYAHGGRHLPTLFEKIKNKLFL